METEYYKIQRNDGKIFTCRFHDGGWETDFDESGDFLTIDDLELCLHMAVAMNELRLFHRCRVVKFKLIESNDCINEGQRQFERIMFEEI